MEPKIIFATGNENKMKEIPQNGGEDENIEEISLRRSTRPTQTTRN